MFAGYEDIPVNTQSGLIRYVYHHIAPGSFLTAVLNNDLKNSVLLADEDNLKNLKTIVRFCTNEIPELFGTEYFNNWINHKPGFRIVRKIG